MQFEIWLCGQNKGVQKKYWDIFQGSDWDKSNIAPTPERSVLEEVLVESPDFDQPEELIKVLEIGVIRFTDEIVDALG